MNFREQIDMIRDCVDGGLIDAATAADVLAEVTVAGPPSEAIHGLDDDWTRTASGTGGGSRDDPVREPTPRPRRLPDGRVSAAPRRKAPPHQHPGGWAMTADPTNTSPILDAAADAMETNSRLTVLQAINLGAREPFGWSVGTLPAMLALADHVGIDLAPYDSDQLTLGAATLRLLATWNQETPRDELVRGLREAAAAERGRAAA